jgi:hypothetical protein
MTVRGTELATQAAHHPRIDRRRFLLTSLAGALLAPLAAGAQAKVVKLGWLSDGVRPGNSHLLEALLQGLRDGYVEGQTLIIERRDAAQRMDRLASELASEKVNIIVATSGAAALATAPRDRPLAVRRTRSGPRPSAAGPADSRCGTPRPARPRCRSTAAIVVLPPQRLRDFGLQRLLHDLADGELEQFRARVAVSHALGQPLIKLLARPL